MIPEALQAGLGRGRFHAYRGGMPEQPHVTVTTWPAFHTRWRGPRNFLMAGECVPFNFPMPPLEQVVDELRRDPDARIGSGRRGDRLLLDDHRQEFAAMPLQRALQSPFSLAHFQLSRFDAPGRFLHGFRESVLDPWQRALQANGFTWTRCYPIIFISGPGCATNYHMDFSHVLAWQVCGTKRFCGLLDPDRWAPRDVRLAYKAGELGRPAELTDDDTLAYEMRPGAVLWNVLLTPHWVEAADEAAMSVNLSHGGLRHDGRLSPNEQELEDYRRQDPRNSPSPVQGRY